MDVGFDFVNEYMRNGVRVLHLGLVLYIRKWRECVGFAFGSVHED